MTSNRSNAPDLAPEGADRPGRPGSAADAVPLEARDLLRRYGSRTALELAELRVARGEGIALLGPNGAGKTTLLGMLAGALRPDRGVVTVCGSSVRSTRARARIGFVPQDAAVYEDLDAEENARLFARLSGVRRAELSAAVQGALEAADLWSRRGELVRTFSGGTRRRLSIACALVHQPALLLLDEPFVGVDDASRRKLVALLARQKQAGLALVVSTHRLAEVSSLCDRLLWLRDGRAAGERSLRDERGVISLGGPSRLRAASDGAEP